MKPRKTTSLAANQQSTCGERLNSVCTRGIDTTHRIDARFFAGLIHDCSARWSARLVLLHAVSTAPSRDDDQECGCQGNLETSLRWMAWIASQHTTLPVLEFTTIARGTRAEENNVDHMHVDPLLLDRGGSTGNPDWCIILVTPALQRGASSRRTPTFVSGSLHHHASVSGLLERPSCTHVDDWACFTPSISSHTTETLACL